MVRVPGFIIPLEDGDYVSEFLFVPYPMACIHVPAPPPNQIIHVVMKKGKQIPLVWSEPVWIYGIIHVENSSSEYAETAYFMDGVKSESYEGDFEPDYGEDPTAGFDPSL
jgi:hypothetical protein